MPGYSGTPLPKKLGIKDGFGVSLLHMPAEVKTQLRDALRKCKTLKLANGNINFIFLFATSRAALNRELPAAVKSLAPSGMVWVAWPKKSSGLVSDLDENVVRDVGLASGVVDVKVCAVTDVWSGLKFVIRLKDRAKTR